MRNEINRNRRHDPRIRYRGASASRMDNLTDAVFGIAITLSIFNLANPNSFSDLLDFTKTLPAFLISISFILLIWSEHLNFSEIYTLNDSVLTFLNTAFIALVIFYVYPLRFLTLFLTDMLFGMDLHVNITGDQVPMLMVYYGLLAFALYFVLYWFYQRAHRLKSSLDLNAFEVFHARSQKQRLFIMFTVPVVSIAVTLLISRYSTVWASVAGGMTYWLYMPAIWWWHHRYTRKAATYEHV